MIFKLSKSSDFSSDRKPHPLAFQKEFEKWHTRTCDEETFNKKFSQREGLWRDNGTDHKVNSDGHITRKQGYETLWCIEINSLEDLIKFQESVTDPIIVTGDEIEIYDYYRE